MAKPTFASKIQDRYGSLEEAISVWQSRCLSLEEITVTEKVCMDTLMRTLQQIGATTVRTVRLP